jgi:hypothetical protein
MARRRPTEPTVNPARGAVLVVVAVLVGLLLLRNGLDTSEVVTSTRDDSSADDSGDEAVDDEGTDDTDPTEETVPAKTPAEVSVIVFNASSTNGAGGKYTTALDTAGYMTLEPATAEVKVPTSQVLFTPGFDREAAAVAAAIGAPALAPAPLDPAAPPGDVGAANVVVVLGADLAPLDPPAAPAG